MSPPPSEPALRLKAPETVQAGPQVVAEVAAEPHRENEIIGAPPNPRKASYTGALVLGWLFITASVVLALAAVGTLVTSSDVTPAATVTSSKPMGLAAAALQGVFFFATGLAILQRKKIAVKLVWTVTVLAAVGVIFRGLVPLDIALWLVTLGIAKWFSRKAPLLS